VITPLVPVGIFALACYGATAVLLHFMSKDEDRRLSGNELHTSLLGDAVRDLELSREAIENDIVAMSQEIETLKARLSALPRAVDTNTSVHYNSHNMGLKVKACAQNDEDEGICWFCGQPGCHEH
jgi:hypothetical protein